MTADALKDLLITYGFPARVKKNEVQVQTCLACGNARWNLELNPAVGLVKCWACPLRGSLQNFLSTYLDVHVHIPVQTSALRVERTGALEGSVKGTPVDEVPSACAYLRRRGLDPYILRRYGLEVCTDKSHKWYSRILIPVREYWTQEHAGFVARDYIGSIPKYLSDTASQIMGYRVQGRGVPHLLLEGPLDGIVTHLAGFNAACMLGVDNRGGVEEWAARVSLEDPIGILLDGEALEVAQKLWWRISTIRPDVVLLKLPPTLDPAQINPEVLRVFVHHNMAKASPPTL